MSEVLILGDSRAELARMDGGSFDAIVTDPPYEIGFQGRSWDSTGIAYDPEFWALCLRVLKPGGHLVSFGACRTYHRIACAVEDAGFQIRDSLHWLFGSGFPKSLDFSKAIDKAAGAEREQILVPTKPGNHKGQAGDIALGATGMTGISAPATPEAQQWDGWGTALKPAHEPIVLARKPLAGTIAETVLEYGTGGLNVDGCRVDNGERWDNGNPNFKTKGTRGLYVGGDKGVSLNNSGRSPSHDAGRWPPNVLLSPEAAAKLGDKAKYYPQFGAGPGDAFAYAPKASRKEREAGCDGLPGKSGAEAVGRKEGSAGKANSRAGAGRTARAVRNHHPTVKPVSIMRWLCRMITPPGGIILDPFMGSGTTGVAAKLEGFDFVGIEQSPEYMDIARARINHWKAA